MKVDLRAAYDDLEDAHTAETKEIIIQYITFSKKANFKYGSDTEDWPSHAFTQLMALGRNVHSAKMKEIRDRKISENQGVGLNDY